MTEIPGHKKKWYDNKWVAELISSVPPLLGALFGAFAAYENPLTRGAVWVLVISAIWLCVGLFWKIRIAAQEDERQSPQNPLYAATWVVRASIAAVIGITDQDTDAIRITVHRVMQPNENPTEIEQISPYVGGPGGKAGRRFPIQSGVAGRAATTGKPMGLNFEKSSTFDDRVNALTQYGYNQSQARAIVSTNRLSFFAVPISNPNKIVVAVVYLDSKREKFFDSATGALIINACGGIASYLSEQYR